MMCFSGHIYRHRGRLYRLFLLLLISVASAGCEQAPVTSSLVGSSTAVSSPALSSPVPIDGCDLAVDFPGTPQLARRPRNADEAVQYYGVELRPSPDLIMKYGCTCEAGKRPDQITQYQADNHVRNNFEGKNFRLVKSEYAETAIGKRIVFETVTSSPSGELRLSGHIYYLPACFITIEGMQPATMRTEASRALLDGFFASIRKGRPGPWQRS